MLTRVRMLRSLANRMDRLERMVCEVSPDEADPLVSAGLAELVPIDEPQAEPPATVTQETPPPPPGKKPRAR